jgi:hypothetical protein
MTRRRPNGLWRGKHAEVGKKPGSSAYSRGMTGRILRLLGSAIGHWEAELKLGVGMWRSE